MPNFNLRQLAVDRGPTPPTVVGAHGRRHLLTRFALPALLLFGFVGLLVYASRDMLYPATPVTVMPLVLSTADIEQAAETPLFRAAGWLEPRPSATLVTGLAEGVIEKLFLVEGQEVHEGQVVAQLISADAKLALDAAEADVKLREAERASARVAIVAAKARFERPLHLRAELAGARAGLAKVETELSNLPHLLLAAQARQTFAKLDWDNKQKLTDVVAQALIRKAKSDLDAADAAVEELRARQKYLPIEVAALSDKRDILAERLERKTDETKLLGEAEAALQTADARLSQTQSLRDAARLRLERMQVKAPVSGRVLSVVAKPGGRLTSDSSTVLMLYDPAHMQVRVDVRLDDVGKVLPGQKAKIETAALPGKALEGEVLFITSQASIEKNTLQVKVAVGEHPPALRPDMLCQVTFLAPPRSKQSGGEDRQPYRLFIPRQLLITSSDSTRVWVADLLHGVARLRTLQLGTSAFADLVEVASGLDATDRLIVAGRDGLQEGERIAVSGEDATFGVGGHPISSKK